MPETVSDDDYYQRRGPLQHTGDAAAVIDDPRPGEVPRWTRCTSVIDPAPALERSVSRLTVAGQRHRPGSGNCEAALVWRLSV
ncbi:hypothetical protein Aca07nite_71270 [Actinoplanes capillaceus]|uniref:Uncharacterized protein n=1 Tax=Actinoplanes campanulatus TaxID=113559 RepID=A0ABQ3WU83_9ACTN|nr:hypothetical protein Aca07nite_71270 [Actinoplanes capillaceus]